MRIATWNIRAAIGPGEPFPPAWWRHVQRERLQRIGEIIGRLDADVVALQEVTVMTVDGDLLDQPLELARATGMVVRYGAVHTFALVEPDTGRSIGAATWGNALLTRDEVMDGFAIGLPGGADDDLVEPAESDLPLSGVTFLDAPYGTREPRCAVGGSVSFPSGAPVTIANTHLTYAGTAQRLAQAGALAGLARSLTTPVVVVGDFNAPIEDPCLAPLATDLDDAFETVGVPRGDARRASSGDARIDHILSRGLRALDCRVASEAGTASDHLPVVATFATVDPDS